MLILFLVLNFVISIFNAWSVGRSWVETKAVGGWARFMSWMGATMAAVGFTWCYLVLLAWGAMASGKLPENYAQAMFELGYLIIAVPLIGSGIAITIDSWAYFWRRRTFGSGAIAGLNTAIDVYNIYQVAKHAPGAWDHVKGLLFDSDSDDESSSVFARIAIFLALAAVFGGILTTAAIVRTVAESKASERRFKYAAEE